MAEPTPESKKSAKGDPTSEKTSETTSKSTKTTSKSTGTGGSTAAGGATTTSDKRSGKGTSGNPAKAAEQKKQRVPKFSDNLGDPTGAPLLTARFVLALVLMIAGIAWIAYYYVAVRPGDAGGEPGGPAFMGEWERWNYAVGFGALMLGLAISAHPKTPLGRGRGVVVGMLGCFVIGLIWICTFYVISDDVGRLPVFNDLGQMNLIVGIAFMAVGFTFATKWE